MKLLALSDIHSNSWSLEKIHNRYGENGDVKFCILGDVIGYGPDPVRCLKILKEMDDQGQIYRDSSGRRALIGGNHEMLWLWCEKHYLCFVREISTLSPAERFGKVVDSVHGEINEKFNREHINYDINARALITMLFNMVEMHSPGASEVLEWYRSVIQENKCGPLQLVVPNGKLILAHGSYDEPVHHYLFPCNMDMPGKLEDYIKKRYDKKNKRTVLLHGHTHVPLYLSSGPILQPDFEYGKEVVDASDVIVINPGSVGLPRDFDLRPSLASLEFDRKQVRIAFFREESTDELRDQYLQKLHTNHYPQKIEDYYRSAPMDGRLLKCGEAVSKLRKRSGVHWKGD